MHSFGRDGLLSHTSRAPSIVFRSTFAQNSSLDRSVSVPEGSSTTPVSSIVSLVVVAVSCVVVVAPSEETVLAFATAVAITEAKSAPLRVSVAVAEDEVVLNVERAAWSTPIASVGEGSTTEVSTTDASSCRRPRCAGAGAASVAPARPSTRVLWRER